MDEFIENKQETSSTSESVYEPKVKPKWFVKMYHHGRQYHRYFAVAANTREEAEDAMALVVNDGWILKKVTKITCNHAVQEL